MNKLPQHLQKVLEQLENNPKRKEEFENAINKKRKFEYKVEEFDCNTLFK